MNNICNISKKASTRVLLVHWMLVIALMLIPTFALEATAQHQRKFDPERFERDLESYVVKKSGLTVQEKNKFLPIYREMRAKQRKVFGEANAHHKPNFDSEKECENMIRQHDSNEIKLKHIQRTYHNKFLTFLSAKKVLKIIGAEDEFHRITLKKVGMRGKKK